MFVLQLLGGRIITEGAGVIHSQDEGYIRMSNATCIRIGTKAKKMFFSSCSLVDGPDLDTIGRRGFCPIAYLVYRYRGSVCNRFLMRSGRRQMPRWLMG